MDKVTANEAIKELTLVLMYLSRFSQDGNSSSAEDFFAWKGYDFGVLNELDDADYIRQGSHPSKSKSVYLTDSGIEKAKMLLEKYRIEDRNP